jgi:hypothetical protein
MLIYPPFNANALPSQTGSPLVAADGTATLSPSSQSVRHLVLAGATTLALGTFADDLFHQITLVVSNGVTHSLTWPGGLSFDVAPVIADDTPHVFELWKAYGGGWKGAQLP